MTRLNEEKESSLVDDIHEVLDKTRRLRKDLTKTIAQIIQLEAKIEQTLGLSEPDKN